MPQSDPFPINNPIVVLIGPTAIGKTSLSIELAKEFDFEIISVDSMQVYRYMNIGTAKITQKEMEGVPHHLIDVVNPDEPFNAGLFEQMALEAIQGIISRGKKVLLTGGTGLYLAALLNGLLEQIPVFPEIRKTIERQLEQEGPHALHEQLSVVDRKSADRIHENDSHRVMRALEIFTGTGKKWSSFIEDHQRQSKIRFENVLILGLRCERDQLYNRIEKRSEIMLSNGLRGEVIGLLEMGYNPQLKSMQSIGYSHMVKFIQGEWSESEMLEKLTRDTRRYAKRQFTWFNKINDIIWIDKKDFNTVNTRVSQFFNCS